MNIDHRTKSVGIAALLSVLLAGLSFASSGCEAEERCVPRETQICSCAPDRQGVQTCEASGNAFTVCDCAEPGDAGLADTSEAADTDASADSGAADTSTASDVADVDGNGADASDAGADADASEQQNPPVELIRELTFEQPDGTNGWSDPAGVVFNWQDHPTGRHLVPDAQVRGATGINPPDISTTVAYRGDRSAHFTMKPWSGSTYRTDMEMLGNRNASPPVERVFHQGTTHLVGFAMRIEHATFDKQGSGDFQLYHQYHNGNPPKAGYGTTRNPALSLLRTNDSDLQVAIRDNRPGEERLNTFEAIPNGVRAGQWVRWVFKTRFSNYDSGENGLVEVWSAVGDEPLERHFRVDDRPVGYAYENPDHNYETIQFDCYGGSLQADAGVYFDEIRIAEGDLDPSVVDPLSWRSYQHPLNQPYNTDLEQGAP